MKVCPKCGYTRRPEDTAPNYECPACGVVYAKATEPEIPAAWRDSRPDSAPRSILGTLVLGVLLVATWASCTSDSSLRRAENRPRSAALERCADAIRANAIHPASVDVKWITGVKTAPAGINLLVSMDFTAKNAFGADLPFQARCLIGPGGEMVTYNVSRR